MFPYYMDSTALLLLPALLLSLWAQWQVKSAFDRYSRVHSRENVTARDVARMLLSRFGMGDMPVNRVAGSLTDHYDPTSRTLSLSEDVYDSTSIAAIGVAAHEVGHAIQHSRSYAPLMFRNSIVPAVNLVSGLSMPLFLLGLFMGSPMLLNVGILLFCGVVVFHMVTLPVEFDASSRALRLLAETGALAPDELSGARRVLRAAALTYVAAALMAVLQLVRLLLLRNSRDR